ncbi:MAG TPA: hypothetical protein PK812_13065, partial [Beijerinckiaceae bacterium]|nr:hypothetical protein [Beijerinckiaceae bacterium]
MVASRLAFGLAGLLMASTAVKAQFILPQDYRQPNTARVQYAPVDRALQPTAPSAHTDNRAPTQQPQAFFPQNFRADKPITQGESRTNWQDHRNQAESRQDVRAPVELQPRAAARIRLHRLAAPQP